MEERTTHTICPAAGCHDNCVLKVHVRGGRVCKVESADHREEPSVRSVCLKGLASIRILEHEDRLKYPLRRVGARGAGRWERVSWEEALQSIAGKLLEVREKHGPAAVKMMIGGSSSVGSLHCRLAPERFANLWGTGGEFEGRGHLADGGVPSGCVQTLGRGNQGHDPRDYQHSRLIIIWGENTAETAVRKMRYIMEARQAGAKLVSISSLYTTTAALSDLWVPVNPGTDAALANAMLHVIIEEGLYDGDYIKRHSVGPLLVREDNGCFLRAEGLPGSLETGFLVWDEETGSCRGMDNASRPALLGRFEINGLACRPAFQLLKEKAGEYTPDRVTSLTGVPWATVAGLAREYANAKPAAICLGHGMTRYYHSSMGVRSVITLAALTGNIGVSGGGASSPSGVGYHLNVNSLAYTKPPGAPGKKRLPGAKNDIIGWDAIRRGEPYPIKAVLTTYRNPLQNYGHIHAWQEILSKMDLVVVNDIFPSRTIKFADFVLPEATVFERTDLGTTLNHYVYMGKAIEPLYDTRSGLDIWRGLAEKVGLGGHFTEGPDEIIATLLTLPHPYLAGVTLERLKREGLVRANLPHEPFYSFKDLKFPSATGRIEFYAERWHEFSEELPAFLEPLESPRTSPQAKAYPLVMLTTKRRYTTQSVLANVDWLRELHPGPYAEMNREDAAARGIAEGDLVEVYNERGKASHKATVKE
ncbi:MAG: molybdopterin-dependent oxidoreductase, partial [Syntrophales bacterium LBB04]|nr:molybdopterin-dependent oxidoreductase [Syntrophales bacterium LBB04]